MVLLAVFSECLPNQFLLSQGVNMLDGTSRMPREAFEKVKVTLSYCVTDPHSARFPAQNTCSAE